ncbi:BrnT family toxin [uncultured Phenylobacterium sp.]|uniref:BrnT family toxin n=1 Tax=uncultured Phenylobacterium sp. TaxID=349273 RepID=UPI0025F83E28|nr:BrnT family toxin [uncultured Phenylobacterium sp.]
MRITYDPDKRAKTLAERNLDFEDAIRVFAGPILEKPDNRHEYGEPRWQTVGLLNERMVMVVWTPRGVDDRHVFSMRKCNDREQERWREQLGRP